jgi:hypothetical protein
MPLAQSGTSRLRLLDTIYASNGSPILAIGIKTERGRRAGLARISAQGRPTLTPFRVPRVSLRT